MASSGSLVPAMGLTGEGAGDAIMGRAGTRGVSSGAEGVDTDVTGALGGVSGTDDTTMEGAGDEAGDDTERHEDWKEENRTILHSSS